MADSPAQRFARLNAIGPAQRPATVLSKAVVLGGSVAGLLAARVLADHAEQVVILERDDSTGPDARPGVPHGTQVHALLRAGRAFLDRWYPGFTDEAVAGGACLVPPEICKISIRGRRKVTIPGEPHFLTCGRPYLEDLIRRRTLALANVDVLTARATGLQVRGRAVNGVETESGVHGADLVVDAMGRSSRLGDWLEAAGWERPPMRRMLLNLNYATADFRRDESVTPFVALAFNPPGEPDGGATFVPIEGGRWRVMIAGFNEERPGSTPEDLIRRFTTTYPEEFAAPVRGELLGEVRTYRHADSRRRDFARLKRVPDGLVAVGDAVASFNPVYGQGMSSAALHAAALAHHLRSGEDFFELQHTVVDAAWSTSTSADLALPHVDGPYPRGYRVSRWLGRHIADASIVDIEIGRRFNRVTGMVSHPKELARPGLMLRAIRANRRARSGRT